MARPKKEDKEVGVGKVSIQQLREQLNKKAGRPVAFNLEIDENPSEVYEWIPTGSTILDATLVRGKKGGIPSGKIIELAGDTSSGKSYMAAQIAGNAQKMGYIAVIFDSESAIDPDFLAKAGCDVNNLLYIQAESVEFVLETIEELLGTGQKYIFVWDSIALTPSKTDIEGTFDPQESMAVKPRILSKGLSKLIQPIANSHSVFLCLNQLKTNLNVQNPKYATDSEKYTTPGGKALAYSYSIRIWLTARKAKDSFILDERGYRIGNEVKCRLEKSRFGTQGRECTFQIMWGDEVGIKDNESIFEALKPFLVQSGAWYALEEGTKKFQQSDWNELMKEEAFRTKVMNMVESEIIVKFDKRTGDAKNFYSVDPVEEQSSEEQA